MHVPSNCSSTSWGVSARSAAAFTRKRPTDMTDSMFTCVYIRLIYWLLLFLVWAILVQQLFQPEGTAQKRNPVQPFDPVPVFLALALIAARWPTFFLNQPLNPDEGWLIAGALRFMHDPVPWRGADLTTSGPLNSYILLVPVALGLQINYVTARMVGVALLITAVICWYVTAKRIRGKFVAISVVLPPITFLCFVQHPDFIHNSTELLPMALLSIAALMVSSLRKNSGVQLFMSAFVLGMVPFAKLQAAPLSVVALLAIFFFAWRIRGERFVKTATVMVTGLLIAPVAMAITLLTTATFDDAWRSYILSGLQLSDNSMGLQAFVGYVLGNKPFSDAILVLVLITGASINFGFLRQQAEREPWLIAGSILYGFTTVYVIYRPGNPWGHYLLFGLPAAVLLATTLSAPWYVGSAWQRACASLSGGKASILFIMAFGLLLFDLRVPPFALALASEQKRDSIAEIIHVLLKQDSHFAVWGYMPQYYVMTGKRPTTRDAITQFQIWDGPQRQYYRTRYLTDFNSSRPNVFVDATGPGNFSFKFLPPEPIETFKELNEIIHSNYVLLLDVKECGTPRTRIFVSLTRLSELNVGAEAIAKASTCLRDSNDLSRLVFRLKHGLMDDKPPPNPVLLPDGDGPAQTQNSRTTLE